MHLIQNVSMKIAYITNFKDMSMSNVSMSSKSYMLKLNKLTMKMDTDMDMVMKMLGMYTNSDTFCFIITNFFLKKSLLSIFFFSPYQISKYTVHIVQCLDPLPLATPAQSAKLRKIISITIVGKKRESAPQSNRHSLPDKRS